MEIAHLYLCFFKLRAALNPMLQFDIPTAKLKASIPTKIRICHCLPDLMKQLSKQFQKLTFVQLALCSKYDFG